jgi:hypothetical protein
MELFVFLGLYEIFVKFESMFIIVIIQTSRLRKLKNTILQAV